LEASQFGTLKHHPRDATQARPAANRLATGCSALLQRTGPGSGLRTTSAGASLRHGSRAANLPRSWRPLLHNIPTESPSRLVFAADPNVLELKASVQALRTQLAAEA